MNITTSIHVESNDQPDATITNSGIPLAHLSLGDGIFRAAIVSSDPGYLRRLAAAAATAADDLTTALDATTPLALATA